MKLKIPEIGAATCWKFEAYTRTHTVIIISVGTELTVAGHHLGEKYWHLKVKTQIEQLSAKVDRNSASAEPIFSTECTAYFRRLLYSGLSFFQHSPTADSGLLINS